MNTLTRVPAVLVRVASRIDVHNASPAWRFCLPSSAAAADVDSDVGTAARSLRNRICDFVCPVTCVACMMTVFLIASPAIASELEGRSWVYLPSDLMAVIGLDLESIWSPSRGD